MILIVKKNDNEKIYSCTTILEQYEYVRKLVNPSGTSLYFMLNRSSIKEHGVMELKMPFRDEEFIKDVIRTLNEFEDIDRIVIECKDNDNIDITMYAGLIPHNLKHVYQTVGTIETY